MADRKAGRKGMFTREIEKQLLVRRIDLAVHSAKDLPSERMEDLEICAALPRGQHRGCLDHEGGPWPNESCRKARRSRPAASDDSISCAGNGPI